MHQIFASVVHLSKKKESGIVARKQTYSVATKKQIKHNATLGLTSVPRNIYTMAVLSILSSKGQIQPLDAELFEKVKNLSLQPPFDAAESQFF